MSLIAVKCQNLQQLTYHSKVHHGSEVLSKMSSGEEFDSDDQIEEILHQRKRKGQLQYLVRWAGLSKTYESWEPASVLAKLPKLLKAFKAQEKERRSRSRSRGRRRSSSRSRSRSSSRKNASSKKKSKSTQKTVIGSSVKKEEIVQEKEESRQQSKLHSQQESAESETNKTEVKDQASTTRKRGSARKKLDNEKPPESRQPSEEKEMLRTRLVVQQVQNDQNVESKAPSADIKEPWIWCFADHAVLAVFVIISVIALSFCLDSVTGNQKQMIPNFSVLRQRLIETYEHMIGSVTDISNAVLKLLPAWHSGAEEKP